MRALFFPLSCGSFRAGLQAVSSKPGIVHLAGPAPLNEDAATRRLPKEVPARLFRLLLGHRDSRRDFAVRIVIAGIDPHGTHRERRPRLKNQFPLTVFGHIATVTMAVRTAHPTHRLAEAIDDFPAASFPVSTLEDNEEIVTTDMPDKVDILIDRLTDHASQDLDDVVAAAIAVGIVVRFESVDIEIGDDKVFARCQHAVDVLVDRHVTGELGKRGLA